MRVNLILLLSTLIFGLFLWVTLSGASLALGFLFLLFLLVITIGYPDKAILFYLGAREVRSRDEALFFKTASQEAYKLAVNMPHLYFYNGSVERGFVLQNKNVTSIILSKNLLHTVDESELHAICFELLLQVKKGMASKRTKVMFLLGSCSWISHSLVSLFARLFPLREVKEALDWILNYLLHPLLDFLFSITLGQGYFKKLSSYLGDYPYEKELLLKLGLKLREPESVYSLPSRKLHEFSAVSRSRHYQNILAMEFLPHEWDYFFSKEGLTRAQ
ncbi:MAG: hypothetical protein V4598_14540 [Bdellovibrionota bacterium]